MANRRTQLGRVGIEKIRVYPTALKLDLGELARARQFDADYVHNELMVYERGVNPVWEDPVTMAVNAAKPMLSQEDLDSIGLLIVGTESGLDLEKSLSSWVHGFLGLPSTCRNFEIKSACYSGTAGLRMAASWLLSGMARPGQKALVIATDQSISALGKPYEYVGGAGAVAMLISNEPAFLELAPQQFGVYAHEVTDVIRPMPWMEIGNGEQSLFSYMEGLHGACEDYAENVGEEDLDEAFDYNIYHVPFSGISFRAHKQLIQYAKTVTRAEIAKSFEAKSQPAIRFPQRIGATYGASTFIALLSLVHHAENIKPGDKIGVFGYGTGSCAELYLTLVGEKAKEVAKTAGLGALLDQRKSLSLADYEALENARHAMITDPDFQPDLTMASNVYQTHYEGSGLLVYQGSQNFHRQYAFV